MNMEDDLISKLIEETCKEEQEETPQEDGKVFELSNYFEKRINQVEFLSLEKYIVQQDLNSFELSYNQNNGCYRLTTNKMTLDFPSNWSLFHTLKINKLQWVNAHENTDFLCDIFSEVLGSCEAFALTNDNGKFNVTLFADGSANEHYEWMLNYFSKKEMDQVKKTA